MNTWERGLRLTFVPAQGVRPGPAGRMAPSGEELVAAVTGFDE